MKYLFLFFVVFGNLWIWRIFNLNILLFFLLILTSFFLYAGLKDGGSKKKWVALLMTLLLIFQWTTTEKVSLIDLSNDQKRVQDARLREYPPVFVKLRKKTLFIPMAHWFEGRKESIAFFRVLNNFSETIDLNLYFFANHPRERVGFDEFEKFPYVFLPLFVYGFVLAVKKEKWTMLTLSFLLPVLLSSFIGQKNEMGTFSLFPFFVAITAIGTKNAFFLVSKKKRRLAIALGTVFFFFIFLQTIGYEIN